MTSSIQSFLIYHSAGFSEDDNAKDNMRVSCKGCPYGDFRYVHNLYGKDNYAHHWIEASFAGEKTQFTYGNADFPHYTLEGKGGDQEGDSIFEYLHVYYSGVGGCVG